MDLATSIANAQIVRVAIVDDDLSLQISTEDLRRIEADVASLLGDPSDPDRTAYLALLTESGREWEGLPDLASPLGEAEVRDRAPERLKNAALAVLSARFENAEPVRRIQSILESAGIIGAEIDHYSTPLLPDDRWYDLLIVDYFLVDNSEALTVPFVRGVLRAHEAQAKPLQIILMSSHEAELKRVFKDLRPQLSVSSSRMRIMGKPLTNEQDICWKLALHQLAADRNFVKLIEDFVARASTAVEKAAKIQANQLWELDLHAMDVLHEAATLDNDDYSRYVEECLSRNLLSCLEQSDEVRLTLHALGTRLVDHRQEGLVSAAAEIGDSRAAIRGLMSSMEWRNTAALHLTEFPTAGNDLEKAQWARKNIRFGMVLRSPEGNEWLNLTQPCDLAQAKDDGLATTCLLLIGGERAHPSLERQGGSFVQMSAFMSDGDIDVLSWNLRRTQTPSIQDFAKTFGGGWSVVGEMRIDQVQHIAAQYGARVARVALPRTARTWKLNGFAMLASALRDAPPDAEVAGTAISAHALYRGKSIHQVHIDRDDLTALLDAYPGYFDDTALRLYLGIRLDPGKKEGEVFAPRVIHCEAFPITMGALKIAFSSPKWLDRNGDKVLLALWPAP